MAEFLSVVIHLCVLLIGCTGTILPSDFKGASGATHPTVRGINDKPFVAVWNDPLYDRCREKFGINLNLTAYGIANGPDNSVIFYNEAMGLYPFVKNGVVFNGGLPQLVNLTSHLEKSVTDIITKIPDVHYSGLVVIDWEYWQPVWDANRNGTLWEMYRNMSISLVRSRHPDWENTLVEQVARLEFQQAAKSLFESTILLARQLRPNALWGFYHFPYCFYENTTETCAQVGIQASNQMRWLYDRVAALYPSIYLKSSEPYVINDPVPYVQAVLSEAFRVRNNSKNQLTPVFSYCRYQYTETDLFLTTEHLRDTILLSAEMGVSGVVIWVSDDDTKTKENCLELQQYIATALGPLVKTTTDAASHCGQSLCSGHGRCVGEILTCTKTAPSFDMEGNGKERAPSETRRQRRMKAEISELARNSSVTEKCSCRCYDGWKGENCNMKKSNVTEMRPKVGNYVSAFLAPDL